MLNKIGSLRRTAVTEKVETFEGIKSQPQVSEIQVKKLDMGLNDPRLLVVTGISLYPHRIIDSLKFSLNC